MSECDFSCYDGVLSPVMAVSSALEPLYANRIALRSYPLLSSRGPALYFTEETLSSVRERITSGQAFVLPVDAEVRGSVVFEPILRPDGSVSHVFLHVGDPSLSLSDRLSLTGDEILRALQKEFAEPLCAAVNLLDDVAHRIPADLRPAIHTIRRKLLDGSALFCQLAEPYLGESHGIEVCDADAVLLLCTESCPSVRYTSCGYCYIPMSRDAALHLFVDLFSCFLLSSEKKERISVSVEREEHKNIFSFRFSSSPVLQFSEETWDQISKGIFAVNHRLSRSGGNCCLEDLGAGRFRILLTFPEIRFAASQVTVGDPSRDRLSNSVRLALEYLRILSEEEC